MQFPTAGPTLEDLLSRFWPVGSIFISVVPTNPANLLGAGTWQAFGTGRTIIGIDAGDTDFNAAEKVFGEKSHALTSGEMPSHTHVQDPHNHTQIAHNHTQDPHTHVQDPHTHTQNAHSHGEQLQGGTTGTTTGTHLMGSAATGGSLRTAGQSTLPATAVNNNATATNQNATATNQAATAVNQAATATNQNTGGGVAHNNVQPSIVVYMWKRVA